MSGILPGKTAIVTGEAHGLGAEIACKFGAEGAFVDDVSLAADGGVTAG